MSAKSGRRASCGPFLALSYSIRADDLVAQPQDEKAGSVQRTVTLILNSKIESRMRVLPQSGRVGSAC